MNSQPPPPPQRHPPRPLAAIILAAGKGTRMQSDLPKVAHAVAGQPMVRWVVEAVRRAGADRLVLVVGHQAEIVKDIFSTDQEDITFVYQDQQLGTAHAARCAEPALTGFSGDILVLAGDGPLIRAETIETMVARHRETAAAATLATACIADPTGYGRIVRDEHDRFKAIVEHKHADDEQRKISEVYPSYACFRSSALFQTLKTLPANENTGEFYITDAFARLKNQGEHVEIVDAVPPQDVLSINTPEQLQAVEAILRERRQTDDRTARSAASPGSTPRSGEPPVERRSASLEAGSEVNA